MITRCGATIAAVLAVSGCRAGTDDRPAKETARATPIAEATDTCLSLPSAKMPGYANPADSMKTPPLAPGSWEETHRLPMKEFSLEIPLVVSASPPSEGFRLSGFPDCGDKCALKVRIFPDSSKKGVDEYVAALLRREAKVDSSNADPRTKDHEFNE